MQTCVPLDHLSDHELIAEVHRLVACERTATAQLVASLAELDTRRLYLGTGCSSLFTYCVHVLHLSDDAAYTRIVVARTARTFPLVLQYLAEGAVHLTAVRLLAAHLTAANHKELLDEARHKNKRDIEHIVVQLRPRPDVPNVVRKLPSPTPAPLSAKLTPPASILPVGKTASPSSPTGEAATAAAIWSKLPPARCAVVAPLSPERYKVQLTVSRETCDKLRRVQDLMRHTVANGDVAIIFDRALTLLLEELERRKLAAADRPRVHITARHRSRHVPAAVRRAVWKRDGGRCAFKGTHGRCTETGFLELHHLVPYAAGGETSVANMELRCRAHNAYESDKEFGAEPWTLRERSPAWPGCSGTSCGRDAAFAR